MIILILTTAGREEVSAAYFHRNTVPADVQHKIDVLRASQPQAASLATSSLFPTGTTFSGHVHEDRAGGASCNSVFDTLSKSLIVFSLVIDEFFSLKFIFAFFQYFLNSCILIFNATLQIQIKLVIYGINLFFHFEFLLLIPIVCQNIRELGY